ncbi:hypothetical protein SSX86_021094 [Deinandra increscens subsp. villosa]|uniref:BZIP domain-containing protein n=1 Tax=Deinandra increscens subsp. villosa TaxID=3103831 RepID=A0AAP0GVG3_9ASTR
MATSSGTTMTSSGGSYPYPVQSSGSEEDLKQLLDQKRKKRMISNRESARRSRERKQRHIDELTSQVSQLRKDNSQMMASVSVTTQHCVNLETENRVLRAQVAELSQQLQSLNEIIGFMCPLFAEEVYGGGTELVDELMGNSVSYGYGNHQGIVACAPDVFMY